MTPTSLTLKSIGATKTLTVCTRYFSNYSVRVSPAGVVSVHAQAAPMQSTKRGIHSASFSVTAVGTGVATIRVSDKKHHEAKVTVTVAITTMKSLFVSNGNFGHVNVAELTPPSYGLTATISKGLSGPEGLAFDASGNLFVANSSGIEGVNQGTVTVYAPTSGALVATITNSVVEPTFVAFDARGNLFVANVGNDTVTEYAPPCSGAPIATISNSLSGPEGLAFDASGNLFVANPTPYLGGIGTVDEYTPPYTGTPTEIGDVLSVNGPQGLAFGP